MIRQTLQKTLPVIEVIGPATISTGSEELLLAKSILYVAEISAVSMDLDNGLIKLQGSLDGSNWIDLDSKTVTQNELLDLKDLEGQYLFYRVQLSATLGSFEAELTLLAKRGYQ